MMRAQNDRDILVILSGRAQDVWVLQCAEAIRGRRQASIHVVRSASPSSVEADGEAARSDTHLRYPVREHLLHYPPCGDVVETARSLIRTARIGMLVADWEPSPDRFKPVLGLAMGQNLPSVFLRGGRETSIRRVLVPTHGGPHTLQQLWVAGELAAHFGAETAMFSVSTPGDPCGGPGEAAEAAGRLARIQARLMGIDGTLETVTADDVVAGIETRARRGDMIVLGAPSYWQAARHFELSTPHLVAARLSNPLAMLMARRPGRFRPRDVFWEQTVCLGLAPRDSREAIGMLLDALVRHNQVPQESRAELLERALAREAIRPTAAGCETAFPHIAVEGFTGVAGCLGICPGGVSWRSPFGDGGDETVRFVFLLITPADYYGDFLAVLARTARLMALPHLREELLACATPAQVMNILDPTPS